VGGSLDLTEWWVEGESRDAAASTGEWSGGDGQKGLDGLWAKNLWASDLGCLCQGACAEVNP
jgi:hypothetical protein